MRPALPSNRSFGWTFTGVFAVGALLYPWALALAALTALVTLTRETWLTPLNRAWMAFGELLGRVVSPIVLGVIFFGVFTPIGWNTSPLGLDLRLLEFATEVPLHPLLRRMDGHLSVGQSTVVAEAAVHGVPSVATSRQAPDAYPAEAAAGLLLTGTTPDELLSALHRILGAGRQPVTPEQPRAAATMQRLLAGDLSPDP